MLREVVITTPRQEEDILPSRCELTMLQVAGKDNPVREKEKGVKDNDGFYKSRIQL